MSASRPANPREIYLLQPRFPPSYWGLESMLRLTPFRAVTPPLGLRTIGYPAPDLVAAKAWFSQVLGAEPYFDEPFYVGFSVGGFELGLIPDGEPGAAGVQAFWGVPDATAELARLEGLGAQVHESVKDVGGGIKVASVRDPFGNLFSIIENPHFKRDEVR